MKKTRSSRKSKHTQKVKDKQHSEKNKRKFYKFAVYGKIGSGKTTFATRDKDAFVIDINEGGTTVADEGSDVEIENYQHFVYVVNYLPQILQEMRENGQEINVVVIETIQKLRDMTLNDVMKNKSKKPTFNDWEKFFERIVGMYRLIGRLQEEYQFHFVITGHEGINKDKDDEGKLSTLLSLLKHKNKLKSYHFSK